MKALLSAHPILTCQEAAKLENTILVDEAAEWAAMQKAGIGIAKAVCLDYQELQPLPQGLNVLALLGKGMSTFQEREMKTFMKQAIDEDRQGVLVPVLLEGATREQLPSLAQSFEAVHLQDSDELGEAVAKIHQILMRT